MLYGFQGLEAHAYSAWTSSKINVASRFNTAGWKWKDVGPVSPDVCGAGPYDTVLTASSCLMSISEALSDMFPTNTVVVGPLPSSASLARIAATSFLRAAGLLTTAKDVGIRRARVGVIKPMWTGIIGPPAKANARYGLTDLQWGGEYNESHTIACCCALFVASACL